MATLVLYQLQGSIDSHSLKCLNRIFDAVKSLYFFFHTFWHTTRPRLSLIP